MNTRRIIARLDIKGDNLVKGVHLEGLRVLGKPWDFARYYYESGVDELFYQDVVASLYGRNCLKEIITKTAKEIFIPLTVGGGIRTIADISDVLRAGADKVSLNTIALKDPKLIEDAVKIYGSSTIVVAIEVIKQDNEKYLAFTDNGREYTGVDAIEWARKVEELGAGEVIITSVDRDGTGLGFDLELIRLISKEVSIPVIVHGGALSHIHILDAFNIEGVDAVAIASMIHYGYHNNKAVVDQYSHEDVGNIEFLRKGIKYKGFGAESIRFVKDRLIDNGINCRV